jgi:hypothetical protein
VDDKGSKRVLLLAARQPELTGLLEEAGFDVEVRRRPLGGEAPDVDLAVVFRGRLTSEPTGTSSRDWLRISNRIHKPDLVQIVRSLADGTA